MAPQDNLIQIAQEFAMIDDFYLRGRRSYAPPKTIDSEQAAKIYGGVLDIARPRQQGCLHQHQPTQSVVHQLKPVRAAEGKMSYYEGGASSVMDYSKRKSRAVAY